MLLLLQGYWLKPLAIRLDIGTANLTVHIPA